MKKNKIISLLLISMSLGLPTISVAASAAGAAGAGARAAMISSSASRSAASASSAARLANQTRSSSSNAALYTSMGVSAGLLMGSSFDEVDSKTPHAEIARRIAIINIAQASDDKALKKEADIARNELAGYQQHRDQIKKEGGQKKFLKTLFSQKNPQDEIAARINIIKLVGASNDPVLLKEADIARSELKGYREYKENAASSKSRENKNPKDEILSRINIIVMSKDIDDSVVKKEADIARSELSGYQEYRASHKTKPITDSSNIDNEIDWRFSIIKISQEIDDAVVTREAEIAKSDLAAYRNSNGAANPDTKTQPKINNQEQAQIQNQDDVERQPITEVEPDKDDVESDSLLMNDSQLYTNIAVYGSIGVFTLIIIQILRRRKKIRDKERDKYIKKIHYK